NPQDGGDGWRRHRRALGRDRTVPRALDQRRRGPPASTAGLSAPGPAVAATAAGSRTIPACRRARSTRRSHRGARARSVQRRPRPAGGRTQMKAILDHIGIAVEDIDAALTFYRDALGLEIEAPEEVASQRVRAHIIPTGESAIELLEATAPDSPIARYLQKRGPGIHHITLRVDDIRAALDHLRARGVRLIDDQPRPGAQSALVAFIHPTAAHGVLVELKQAARPRASLTARRLPFGDFALTNVHDGLFGLDGGAMFGVVPRTLWASQSPPDDRNRILLATRPLLVEADWGRLLVDCGIGDKMDAKQRDIYAVIRDQALDEALASAGLAADRIDAVLATHLHFDHFGGATVRRGGRLEPRFA